jgi:hypothetical protein
MESVLRRIAQLPPTRTRCFMAREAPDDLTSKAEGKAILRFGF